MKRQGSTSVTNGASATQTHAPWRGIAETVLTERRRAEPETHGPTIELGTLDRYVTPNFRPPVGIGGPAWKYEILVPIASLNADGAMALASELDIQSLVEAFGRHFGGSTGPVVIPGFGSASPQGTADSRQVHAQLFVCTAIDPAVDAYFRALRCILERALGQANVWVERREVALLGR
jgi:hypothetical protein